MNATMLFLGLVINLAVATLIVRFIYYPGRQNKNFVFTFLAFSTVIYLVVSFLAIAEVGMGVGFGLFALFSLLRYRTSPMPAREMTYLFVLIALSVMSAILMQSADWRALLAISAVVVAVILVLEREWGFVYEGVKTIKYDRAELVHADRYAELLADLRQRTGLELTRVEVGGINLVNGTAHVKVFYDAGVGRGRHYSADADGNGDDD